MPVSWTPHSDPPPQRGRATPVLPLQIALEELEQSPLHVDAVSFGAWHVTLIWIDQRFERLARIDQRLHQASGMPEVNVLVDHAVHHEEPPAELVDVAQRRGPPVPIRIVPGSTHIVLGVGGVVALVSGNRRPGYAGFEDVGGRGA